MSKEEIKSLDIQDIMKLLPHRYPFLLVDRVTEIVPNEKIVAYKNLTFNEPFFQGHFPDFPVMPGVLICEAMAQAGGVLFHYSQKTDSDSLFMFAGLDKVRFRRPVRPGDRLDIVVGDVRVRRTILKMKAQALVDGELACEAEMTAALVNKKDI